MQEKSDIGSMSPEEKLRKKREWFAGLRPCDDILMRFVFSHRECVECVLKPLLQLDGLELVEVQTQKEIPGIKVDGRAVRLDVLAQDSMNRYYNIEFQRRRGGMSVRRTRLYGDAVDLLSSERGADFDALPETFVIVICGFDMFKRGQKIYTAQTYIRELDEIVDDGRHVMYLNAPLIMQDTGSELGRVMHDLWCAEPDEMYNRELGEVVSYYKQGKGEHMVINGIEIEGFMGELIAYEAAQAAAKAAAKAEARGEARGETKGKLMNALQNLKTLMRRMNWSADEAMDALDVGAEDRQNLKKLLLQESEV